MKLNVSVFCLINIIIYHRAFAENGKSVGPYKCTMMNATRCEKPSRPYQKEPSLVFSAEVYNTTKQTNLLRGNITILKENADYKIKIKCYTQEAGKWTISLVTNSGGCRGILLSLYTTLLGLKYDKEKCSLEKGTFNFANVDTNQVEHAWLSTKTYGVTKCRIEVFFGIYTAECWEFYEILSPRQ